MPYVVRSAAPGLKGVDLVSTVTLAGARRLQEAGVGFVVRYLGLLTKAEMNGILGAGLGISFVTLSRSPGWEASATIGKEDGDLAAIRAHNLEVPAGATIWCDFEGADPKSDRMGYVNAWAREVAAAGFQPGLYVGYSDAPLSSEELYHLAVVRYWHSCSIVPPVAERGYCLVQSNPANVWLCGMQVDLDVTRNDEKGDAVSLVYAEPECLAA
jgi:hypothetical protein